jgi:hypothetical protein
MKVAYLFTLVLMTAAANAQTGTTILDDTFANGSSQVQDLANNSVWLFDGRAGTVRTDQKGSVSFDIMKAVAPKRFWALFPERRAEGGDVGRVLRAGAQRADGQR